MVAFPDHLRFPDQMDTADTHGLRGDKGGRRSSQVLCGPAGQILAEIRPPCAPRDPRTLAMVQGVTRHFEQNQRSRRGPLGVAPDTLFTPLIYPSLV